MTRWSWLLGGIWLLFLGFPLAATWSVPGFTHPQRIGITALIGLFAAVYMWIVWEAYGTDTPLFEVRGHPRVYLALGILIVLTVFCGYILGPSAAGMAIYVHAYGAFTLSLRQAIALTGACMLAVAIWFTVLGVWGQVGFLMGIMAAAGGATIASRYFGEQSEQEAKLESELLVFAERDRLATDIHDLLGHTLTVITMKSELAKRLLDRDPAAARSELEQIHSLARESMAQIRTTISGLHTPQLADELLAVPAALASAGITAHIQGDELTADPQLRPLFAWVLREASTNMIRHSGARNCLIVIEPRRLVVIDDGVGLPPTHHLTSGAAPLGDTPAGTGLRGTSNRVVQAGGMFTAQTWVAARNTTRYAQLLGEAAANFTLTPPNQGTFLAVEL